MKFWKTHQFKKLNDKWRDKLKKSGFDDLENSDGQMFHHATVREDLEKRTNFYPSIMGEVQAYYRWAEDMANHGKFRSTLDKKIWALHSRGMTSREIVEQLPVKLSQWSVCAHIRKTREYLRLQIRKESKAA